MFLSGVNVPIRTITLSSENSSSSTNGKVFKVDDFDLLQKFKNQFESNATDCTEINLEEFEFVIKLKEEKQKTEIEIISELPKPKKNRSWVRIESTATYEENEVWLVEVPKIYQNFGQIENLKWEAEEEIEEGRAVLVSKECFAGCEQRIFSNEVLSIKK